MADRFVRDPMTLAEEQASLARRLPAPPMMAPGKHHKTADGNELFNENGITPLFAAAIDNDRGR